MVNARFATAINCIDGRTQLPVIQWLRERCDVDYVDMINEPGVDRIVAESESQSLVESIRIKVRISIDKHGSKLIAIVGHHDCAGNPVDKSVHLTQIRAAIKTIESWRYDAQVVGLWVDGRWLVQEITAKEDPAETI